MKFVFAVRVMSLAMFGAWLLAPPAFSTPMLEAADCVECSIAKPKPPIPIATQKKLSDISEKVLSIDERTFLDPQFIEKMDSRLLGEMIVKRLSDMCDKARDPGLKKPAEDSSEIIMLVPDKYLSSIAKNGFKNQHETSSTGGCKCQHTRLDTETKHVHLGLPYNRKARELLPKYALQVFNDKSMGTYPIPSNYGNVMVRFKPEVKKRATWSHIDSLSLARALQTNSITPNAEHSCVGYCEAQIWGELDMTDVSSLVVEKGSDVTKEMKALGVPIYTYEKKSKPDKDEIYNCSKEDIEKAKTSLCGIDISFAPHYTPPKGTVIARKENLSLESATEEYMKADKDAAFTNVLNGIRLSKMSTESLIQEYRTAAKEQVEQQIREQNSGMKKRMAMLNPSEGKALTDLQTRTLAEIATRNSEKNVTQFLLNEYKNAQGEDASLIKAMALTGLSNLDFKKLKPLLLDGIKSLAGATKSTQKLEVLEGIAVMIALQYKDNPEIAAALRAHSDLFQRMEANEICIPKKYN